MFNNNNKVMPLEAGLQKRSVLTQVCESSRAGLAGCLVMAVKCQVSASMPPCEEALTGGCKGAWGAGRQGFNLNHLGNWY